MDPVSETTPLLHPEAGFAVDQPPVTTRLQRWATSLLATLHVLRGLALVACPAAVLAIFSVPESSYAFFLTIVLGVRDAMLGGLLAMADPNRSHEIPRALAIALASDAVDTFIIIFVAASHGDHKSPVLGILSVALLAILEHCTLWSFGRDDPPTTSIHFRQAIVQTDRLEGKRLRLGMWLEDLKRAEQGQHQSLPCSDYERA